MLMRIFVIVIIGCILILGAGSAFAADEAYYRGVILSVTNSQPGDGFITLKQEAQVLIRSGSFQGERVVVTNNYVEDDIFSNIYLKKGMEIILASSSVSGGLYFHGVARDRGLLYLLGIFLSLLLIIGGRRGLKAIFSLVFAALVIFAVLLPLILQGFEPISAATVSAVSIIIVTFLMIGGFTKKTLAAILGTVFGVVAAGLLALWVGELSYLTGFNSEEAQMLFYMGKAINIRGLLFAGIIIGSLGAVTDVGMSIASAVSEIKEANKRARPAHLTAAGLNVGKDIMGTMANTLLLAYVGGAFPLLLVLAGYEMPWLRIVNMDEIATEFVRGMAGSIGLIISVPVTAVTAGFLMGKK